MKCPQCPYYEQNTSYGTELVKCNNKECKKRQKARKNNMSYPEERDKAFIEFVKNDNIKPFVKLCKKYGLVRPKSWKVERAGIYKAVQYCTNIPEDVRVLAMQKCLKMGFNPLIKPIETESEDKE